MRFRLRNDRMQMNICLRANPGNGSLAARCPLDLIEAERISDGTDRFLESLGRFASEGFVNHRFSSLRHPWRQSLIMSEPNDGILQDRSGIPVSMLRAARDE